MYNTYLSCVCFLCVCSWESQTASRAECGEGSGRASVCGGRQRENSHLPGCVCHELPPSQQRQLQGPGCVNIRTVTTTSTHSPQCECEWVGIMCVSGGIPAVVQLLNNESLALREAATQALSSLTHSNQLNALWVTHNLSGFLCYSWICYVFCVLLDSLNVIPTVSY